MTPRWRAVLRLQRLLRSLIMNHVPLGVLHVEAERATSVADVGLVEAEADISGRGLVHEIARRLAEDIVGDEPFGNAAPRGKPAALDAELVHAMRLELRAYMRRLHQHGPLDATAAADRLTGVIMRVDEALGGGLPDIEVVS